MKEQIQDILWSYKVISNPLYKSPEKTKSSISKQMILTSIDKSVQIKTKWSELDISENKPRRSKFIILKEMNKDDTSRSKQEQLKRESNISEFLSIDVSIYQQLLNFIFIFLFEFYLKIH